MTPFPTLKARKIAGFASAGGLLLTLVLANWLTTHFGFVPVGFGLLATAGTFAAGVALALRDSTQDLLGTRWMLATIAAGTLLSYALADPFIATASAAAFLLSELVNYFIYTPIRRKADLGGRRWAVAVAGSNLGSSIADTVVFLGLAFGWAAIMPALAGQLVGKTWATLVYLALGKAVASGSVPSESDQLKVGA